MQKSTLKTGAGKINNESLSALNSIRVIENDSLFSFSWSFTDFIRALDHYNWDFDKSNGSKDFHDVAMSICDINRNKGISKYQRYCIVQLSTILHDAKVLYENNMINFGELRSIVLRVRKDSYKRFLSIKKSYAKKQLQDNNLDRDSLVLLQAKLAILENEN